MTTYSVTTAQNYQALTAPAGNDTYNIDSGELTIDTDTRYCTNHSATTGQLGGAVSISSTRGGKIIIDGTKVRLIPYNTGTGNVPAIGTTISQGGISAYLLGVWSALNVAPTAAAAAMPASGYIKVKNVTGGSFAAGALTGIGASATGADVVGWIEIVGIEATTITVPRLGEFVMSGSWFEVGTTSGAANQTIQMPASLANTYYPGVWIETGSGTGVYEFYPAAGSATTTRQDKAGKVVWISSQGLLRIGNSGAATNGYLPASGCKIRVPNIITLNCNSTSGYDVNVLPNATLTTRRDFTTTCGGTIVIDKANLAWWPSFTQAFSIAMSNTGILEQLQITECASTITLDNVGVGQTAAQAQYALFMTLCFAGGTISNCVWSTATLAASGRYVISITDCFGFDFTNDTIRSCVARGNATSGCATLVRVKECTWDGLYLLGGGKFFLTTCADCAISNIHYVDIPGTSYSTSYGQYILSITANSKNCVFDTIDFWGLTTSTEQPYAGLWNIISAVSNIKIRNMGTAASPLSLGASNQPAYFAVGVADSGCKNIEFKRIYVTNTRTGFQSNLDNSYSDVIYKNVWTDAADSDVWATHNTTVMGMKGTNTVTGQTSVYGTHWFDIFTSSTAGRIGIACNEKTAEEPSNSSYSLVVAGVGCGFDSVGRIVMPNVDDEIIWTTPNWIIGHKSFTNSAPTLTGVNVSGGTAPTYGNFKLQYKIDKGSGYGGSWTDLTAANLSGETGINAQTGFKLQIRLTVVTASTTNAMTYMTFPTDSDATSQAYQYPLDVVDLSLTNLQPNSEVRAYVGTSPATAVEIGGIEDSGTSFTFQHSSGGSDGYIHIHALGYLSIELPITYLSADQSIPIQQFIDRQYQNPA